MELVRLSIAGLFETRSNAVHDQRGTFVKVFHDASFRAHGLKFQAVEQYYSLSRRSVIRGLHFQSPPYGHDKLVYCVFGRVFDAVVDLRLRSPTYGQYATFELSPEHANAIFVPTGLAHGFYVQSEEAILVYSTTSEHQPTHDTGIRWDSAGIPWPTKEPIVSDRDSALPPLSEFQSPFQYDRQ